MSYIAPEIQDKFDSLSPDLRNIIMDKNVRVNNIHELIHVLEQIVDEGESE